MEDTVKAMENDCKRANSVNDRHFWMQSTVGNISLSTVYEKTAVDRQKCQLSLQSDSVNEFFHTCSFVLYAFKAVIKKLGPFMRRSDLWCCTVDA